MFIPKDELPKGNVQNLTIFSFGITAIGYLVFNSIPGVVLPLTLLLLFFVSFFCFCAGLWFLLFLSKWKRWWAWKRWAKQQGAQTSVANLESVAAPTSEPPRQPPQTSKGVLGHLSPELQKVLKLCTIYLVALDEQFTQTEQDWVDNMFGPGTSQRFIQTMSTMDWRDCFSDIYQQIITLPPTDQLFLKQSAHSLFQGLMESDGLKDVEQDRLEDLMRYIRQSLEKVT